MNELLSLSGENSLAGVAVAVVSYLIGYFVKHRKTRKQNDRRIKQ